LILIININDNSNIQLFINNRFLDKYSLCLGSNVYSLNSSWLDTTRHVRRVESTHFCCVELVEEHSSTRLTRRAQLARHVELDRHDLQLSYDHRNSFIV